MHRRLISISFLMAFLIFFSAVGCTPAARRSPAASPSPPTTAATAAPTDLPPTRVSTASPSPLPSPTPTVQGLSAQTMALFAAGSAGQARLFALRADGSTLDLDRPVYLRASVSRDGRWLAGPNEQLPTDEVVISNLENGRTHTIPVTAGFDPYGMAFDSSSDRVALLELGSPEAEGTPWALVIVTLEDGSTIRFPAAMGSEGELLPGSPVGWNGDDLIVDTFVPFTEQGSAGLRSITLPPDVTPGPLAALDQRQLLPGEDYLFTPQLSPRETQLLYLNRDYDYTPDNYAPVGYDLAVNQLGLLDLASDSSMLLVEETEGAALGGELAWSPDGALGLFAEGRYRNGTFAALTLKTVDDAGTVTEVAAMPLPPGGFLVSLDWCAPERAAVVVATSEAVHQLHTIDMRSGESSLVASDEEIAVLGCVRRELEGGANADVVHVRAVASAEDTWTFHVTVEHPDTGWEDYADGWDVVTPDGTVLKPDPDSGFTRTLLHPHVDEQPFTRSQRGIVVPEGVTRVRVRAHDIVDGYGGREVVVDLTASSGPDFEVERD